MIPKPESEPSLFPAHPWYPMDGSSWQAELTDLARLCWHSREMHTELDEQRTLPLPDGSPAASESNELLAAPFENDFGGHSRDQIRGAVDAFSALATNNMASVAGAIWTGNYMMPTVAAQIRASVEASVAACWILDPSKNCLERACRAHLLHYNDLVRFCRVPGLDPEFKTELKRIRRQHKRLLDGAGPLVQVEFDNDLLRSISGEVAPTFDSQFVEVGDRAGFERDFQTYYGTLSQWTHPNPATFRVFFAGAGPRYRSIEPDDVRDLVYVAAICYEQLLKHVVGYYRTDHADTVKARWESYVSLVWPDFYGDR